LASRPANFLTKKSLDMVTCTVKDSGTTKTGREWLRIAKKLGIAWVSCFIEVDDASAHPIDSEVEIPKELDDLADWKL
jgi:hypothetical protein